MCVTIGAFSWARSKSRMCYHDTVSRPTEAYLSTCKARHLRTCTQRTCKVLPRIPRHWTEVSALIMIRLMYKSLLFPRYYIIENMFSRSRESIVIVLLRTYCFLSIPFSGIIIMLTRWFLQELKCDKSLYLRIKSAFIKMYLDIGISRVGESMNLYY